MRTVHIHSCLERGQNLLERAARTLQNAPADKVRELAQRLPGTIVPPGESLRVVFAGQYSAGKSSILKMMTGREDIEIGAGITTQQVQGFDWNGIEIIDTPGVHTELRPDHDKLTYEAISGADLLVFVITNELFNSHLADHFRKLAVERDKAHEILLVVNKMQRSAQGNTPAARDVIREDLRKVLVPFSPEELRASFVDAELALSALAEQDEEVSKVYRRKSGFDDFLDNLNAFVAEKRLTARYTTSLYTLDQVLREALAAEPSDDTDVDALEELLLQQRRALMDTRAQLPRAVESQVQRTTDKIRQEGRKAADLIHRGSDPKTINQELKAAQDRVQEDTGVLSERIQKTIEEHLNALAERVNQIAESELAEQLSPRLVKRVEAQVRDMDIDPETLSKAKKTVDVTRQLGEFLIMHSFNPKTSAPFAELFKLNQYSGTATHGMVKDIGHLFGKSFKPWEAVKWTRRIANAGRVLQVAGVILTVILQIKEDADAAKLESDLRESRVAVRAGFDDAAYEIELHFDKATGTYVDRTIGQRLAEVDQQIKELSALRQSRGNLFQHIVGLLDETRGLISEMHSL